MYSLEVNRCTLEQNIDNVTLSVLTISFGKFDVYVGDPSLDQDKHPTPTRNGSRFALRHFPDC